MAVMEAIAEAASSTGAGVKARLLGELERLAAESRCVVGTLDVRFHSCDLSLYHGSGRCSCEYFEFALEPQVSRLPPDQQAEGKYRCQHLRAARDFCLDLSLKAHAMDRLKGARGQREDQQP